MVRLCLHCLVVCFPRCRIEPNIVTKIELGYNVELGYNIELGGVAASAETDETKPKLGGEDSNVKNISCAVLAGSLSSAIANPTDVLKVI